MSNWDIDFSFKKNDVDELFFNLSENPEGFKNKDFRYTLSMIYQIIEDEFAGVFLSPNGATRNTNFHLINKAGKLALLEKNVLLSQDIRSLKIEHFREILYYIDK